MSVVRDRSSHDSIPETLHSILRMGFENVRLDNVKLSESFRVGMIPDALADLCKHEAPATASATAK